MGVQLIADSKYQGKHVTKLERVSESVILR